MLSYWLKISKISFYKTASVMDLFLSRSVISIFLLIEKFKMATIEIQLLT